MENQYTDIYTDASLRGVSTPTNFGIGYTILNEESDEDYKFSLKGNRHFLSDFLGFKSKKVKGIKIHSCNMEMFAILHVIERFVKEGSSKNLRIFTDSMTTFNLINSKDHKIKKNPFWVKLHDRLKEAIENYTGDVQVMWIKGHANIYGNEIADKLSKKAEGQLKVVTQKGNKDNSKVGIDTIKNFFETENESTVLKRELTKLIQSL